MSNQDQAQYLLGLPLSEFKAIKKAVQILKRAGMHGEQALNITVQAHADGKDHNARELAHR